jgi:hypothetical protein
MREFVLTSNQALAAIIIIICRYVSIMQHQQTTKPQIPTPHLPTWPWNKIGVCNQWITLLKAQSSWVITAQDEWCPSRRARRRLVYVVHLPWPDGPSQTVRWTGQFLNRCPTFRPRHQLLLQFHPPLWKVNLTRHFVMTARESQGYTATNENSFRSRTLGCDAM